VKEMQFYNEEIVPDLKMKSYKFPNPTIFPANACYTPSGYWALKIYKLLTVAFAKSGINYT
jgi:hypothetical protein